MNLSQSLCLGLVELRNEIQRELFMRDVQDLELAYHVAHNAERFSRRPMYHKPEAPRTSAPS